jgi:hypothetical protein
VVYRKVWVLFFVMLTALYVAPVRPASAEAAFIRCQGDFIPTGIISPGEWTFPGGNWHVRNMIGQYRQAMPHSDPRCSGLNTVSTNANWDATGAGPSWGTFHVILDADSGYTGGWEGAWMGKTEPDGTTSVRVTGQGYGDLAGMLVFIDIELGGLGSPGIAQGYILSPDGE